MAGIKSSETYPGFKQIVMNPDFKAGLTYVNASYNSIHGLIKSHWKIKRDDLQWEVTIPANTSALVYLPTTKVSDVKVNRQRLTSSKKDYQIKDGKLVLTLKSGTYKIDVNHAF
jgi:alpha-L-rhamnosidase